ncbi:MAG: hypothetical protein JXR63_04440 [Spirochaetales bacterium]|nr:hypothetical protein [Spirochaetales bacterium]
MEQNLHKYWYRLDNAAKAYPSVVSSRMSTLFRFSACLNEPVKVDVLQKALENMVRRCPYYRVSLHPGAFWYFWLPLGVRPLVYADSRYPCIKLPVRKRGYYPWRIRAYRNIVSAEFSHILTDGTGCLVFLNSLLVEYFRLQGIDSERGFPGILYSDEAPTPLETEDSFRKNFKKGVPPPRKSVPAFHLPFKKRKRLFYHVTTGIVSTQMLLQKARDYNVSITEFLAAVLFESYLDLIKQQKIKRGLKPIIITIPVNLRKMYSSHTMKNFFLNVKPEIDPRLGEYDFQEILQIVHHYMKNEVTEKSISRQIARNVKGELNPVARFFPLFMKNVVLKILFSKLGDSLYTTSLSNVGLVRLPKAIEEHVQRYIFVPAPSPNLKVNCSVISYNGTACISFGSVAKEKLLEQIFFRKLVKHGFKVKIETNYREEVWRSVQDVVLK